MARKKSESPKKRDPRDAPKPVRVVGALVGLLAGSFAAGLILSIFYHGTSRPGWWVEFVVITPTGGVCAWLGWRFPGFFMAIIEIFFD